jgi:hypothetical protein
MTIYLDGGHRDLVWLQWVLGILNLLSSIVYLFLRNSGAPEGHLFMYSNFLLIQKQFSILFSFPSASNCKEYRLELQELESPFV